jgi:hypothetical protein
VRALSLEGKFRRQPPPESATGAGPGARAPRGPFGREAAGELTLEVGLPDKLRINGNVVEEWDVTRWRVNPSLKPERFAKQ